MNGLKSLNRFGIPYEKEDEYLGIALGGMNRGVSPLQMASAYSAFPNEGIRMESHLITKIVGPTGNVIADYEPTSTRVPPFPHLQFICNIPALTVKKNNRSSIIDNDSIV